jgi:RNA polymerase sigma factor (sigma-70 family)
MASSHLSQVIESMRQAVLLREGAGGSDGQLLASFLEQGDQVALAALVRRHAAMVWGVCRRVLANHHDAEDAFQATFLVLLRKAASVLPRERVGNWLYGVAHQTARKARADAARRKGRERQAAILPEPQAVEQDPWSELRPLLDQELSRLPDKYRIAIILCDLQGQTRKQAAGRLGVPEGTLAARLARARGVLARRLRQRGLSLAGGTLAALLAQNAAGSVPDPLVSAAIQATCLLAAGRAGAIAPTVWALTEGVLKTMRLAKLKTALAVLLVVALVCCGAGLLTAHGVAGRMEPGKAKAPANAPAKAPAAKALAAKPKPLELRVKLQEVGPLSRLITAGYVRNLDLDFAVWNIPVKLVNLEVAKDAKIRDAEDKAIQLTDLKAGMSVTLELQADASGLLVVGIKKHGGARAKPKKP